MIHTGRLELKQVRSVTATADINFHIINCATIFSTNHFPLASVAETPRPFQGWIENGSLSKNYLMHIPSGRCHLVSNCCFLEWGNGLSRKASEVSPQSVLQIFLKKTWWIHQVIIWLFRYRQAARLLTNWFVMATFKVENKIRNPTYERKLIMIVAMFGRVVPCLRRENINILLVNGERAMKYPDFQIFVNSH